MSATVFAQIKLTLPQLADIVRNAASEWRGPLSDADYYICDALKLDYLEVEYVPDGESFVLLTFGPDVPIEEVKENEEDSDL